MYIFEVDPLNSARQRFFELVQGFIILTFKVKLTAYIRDCLNLRLSEKM